jgi:Zn-dependent protease with chaperone function
MSTQSSSQPGPSLAGRAALAILLMVGFYLLAITLAATLILGPVMVSGVPIRLLLMGWLAGGVVLWSIIPRIDSFEPPGPELDARAQPRLFGEIATIASATGQPMPNEVYLVADVNAFVARRGGVMGFFSRRVMGVGLPLIAALSSAELRAVLAHEFGHYHGGDTALGPWIYKTRATVIRTVVNLQRSGNRLLHWPFRWYGEMFLRVTQAISRRQEFAADALAARVVDPGALATGLHKTARAALALKSYLNIEYSPALAGGFRPPFAAGFASFLDAVGAHGLDDGVDKMIREQRPEPFDSHPPTRERIAALECMPAHAAQLDNRGALELLDDVPELERILLTFVVRGVDPSSLRPIAWSDMSEQLWIPMWVKQRAQFEIWLRKKTVADLPCMGPKLPAIGIAMDPDDPRNARALAERMLGSAFALALIEHGWKLETSLGRKDRLTRGADVIEPFAEFGQLVAGERDGAVWIARARELGIDSLPLWPATLDAGAAGR